MRNAEALTVQQGWDEIFSAQNTAALERILPDYLRASRWFGGKARSISTVRVVEAVLVPYAGNRAYLTSIRVTYEEGEPQTYVLPLTFAPDAASVAPPSAILASVHVEQDGTEGV